MAAAIIPLIAGLAPSIIQLIVGLVHKHAPAAQAASPQPGTGPVRFADVLTAVAQALQQAASAGQIPQAGIPPDATLATLIETIVQSMKQPGGPLDTSGGASIAQIGGAPLNIGGSSVLPNGSISLKPGQSITIQVAS
jgi:hypothetical protein